MIVALKTYLLDSSSVNSQTSMTEYPIINSTPVINEGSFTLDSNGVYVPETAIYRISSSCSFSSSVQRGCVNTAHMIENSLDDSTTSATGYIRAISGHIYSSNLLVTYHSLTAGDSINIGFMRQGNTGTVNLVGANSCINIIKIGEV